MESPVGPGWPLGTIQLIQSEMKHLLTVGQRGLQGFHMQPSKQNKKVPPGSACACAPQRGGLDHLHYMHGERKSQLEKLRIQAEAAEQLFGAGNGAQKKAYVVEYLATQGIDPTAHDADIEAAVLQVNQLVVSADA